MPEEFEKTRLWSSALAPRTEDEHHQQRERLRSSFLRFRSRVAVLAAEINRVMPDYTVHDITHLDALWDTAELIAGSHFTLTPTEAYVLGGGFLLHDLGMGLASYPGGLADLKLEQSWADAVAREFLLQKRRHPTVEEIQNPPRAVQDAVVGSLLRVLHARHAEELPTAQWRLNADEAPQYLIEDSEIRQAFGRVIGRIAHSHWWSADRLADEFRSILGAPYWCPSEWTINPLKLAALLRVADAAHLDGRRAPMFLRRVRRPVGVSDLHWSFQEKLQKLQANGDALVFTSGYAFPFSEAAAWWTCFDTLRMVDEELRRTDALLAEAALDRFAVSRVAGIDRPERLVTYIPTDRWLPVDAALQVGDLPRLVQTLGGAELYGPDLRVPVRELIQNGADAIRARRVTESRSSSWGSIRVVLGEDNYGHWIEVGDTGLGMSRDVLTRYLLDFGTSYWSSPEVVDDLPGLLSSGFSPAGKYGIGFFSVFMLGDRVRVTTRRFDAGQAETTVLEFSAGLAGRPILRPAAADERLRDGGTVVRVWLRTPPHERRGLLTRHTGGPMTLPRLCAHVAPALDVKLVCVERGEEVVAVEASDWITMDACDLLRRLYNMNDVNNEPVDSVECSNYLSAVANNLRLLYNEDGSVVGRAAIVATHSKGRVQVAGVATIGGLSSCGLRGLAGVLVARTTRAARDAGRPIVSPDALARWAAEQVPLAMSLYATSDDHLRVTSAAWALGASVPGMPVALIGTEVRSHDDLLVRVRDLTEVFIVSIEEYARIGSIAPTAVFLPGVLFTDRGLRAGVVQSGAGYWEAWPYDIGFRDVGSQNWVTAGTLDAAIIFAAAEAWNVSARTLLDSTERGSDTKRAVAHVNGRDVLASGTLLLRPLTTDQEPAKVRVG